MTQGLLRGAALCRLALVALPAMLAGCAVDDGAEAARTQRERPAMDTALARLPANVAGFERGATMDVASGDPTAGKVVEYATPGRVAVGHVFLYDSGRPEVTAADLPPEVERAVSEGTALPSDRTGRELTIASRGPVPVPGGDLSCAFLEGRFGRLEVERQVCVGIAAGRFLRVQVTMPSRGASGVDARAFATEIAKAARGGAVPAGAPGR